MALTQKQTAPELDAIRGVVLKTYAAWNSRNTENANPYFRQGPNDMYFDYWPLRFDDWGSYKAGAQAYLDGLNKQGIKERDIRVERLGNTAWVSATYDVDCTSKSGEDFHVRGGRYTGILVKIGGKWKVCHEHWSPPAPQSGEIDTSLKSARKSSAPEGKDTSTNLDLSEPVEKSVHDFLFKAFAAWQTLNIENAAQCYRRDHQDTFFHLHTTKLENWGKYRVNLQTYFDRHIFLKIIADDVRIFREGAVVYVAVSHLLEEEFKDGKKSSREARYTGVLLSSHSSWQIVHEHWSVPVRAAGWENY